MSSTTFREEPNINSLSFINDSKQKRATSFTMNNVASIIIVLRNIVKSL